MAVELNKWELVSTDDKTGTRLLKQFCSETEVEYKLETRNRDALGGESWSSVYDIRANAIYAYKRVDEINQRLALFGLCRMVPSSCDRCKDKKHDQMCNEIGDYSVFVSEVERALEEQNTFRIIEALATLRAAFEEEEEKLLNDDYRSDERATRVGSGSASWCSRMGRKVWERLMDDWKLAYIDRGEGQVTITIVHPENPPVILNVSFATMEILSTLVMHANRPTELKAEAVYHFDSNAVDLKEAAEHVKYCPFFLCKEKERQ